MIKLLFGIKIGAAYRNTKVVNISIEKTIQDLKEKVKKIFNANKLSILYGSKQIMKNNEITIKNYLKTKEGQYYFGKLDLTKEKISFKLDCPLSVSITLKEPVE